VYTMNISSRITPGNVDEKSQIFCEAEKRLRESRDLQKWARRRVERVGCGKGESRPDGHLERRG
jgi:hypothetical protein